MFVCLDANNVAVAWNYDGSLPDLIPAGASAVEVSANAFDVLRTTRVQRAYNGTTFIPVTASAGDFMKALIEMGVYDAVEAAVNAMTGDQGKLAKVLWTRAATIERFNPFVVQIGAALSIDIDAVFTLANSYV
jgi:hypothetical protein